MDDIRNDDRSRIRAIQQDLEFFRRIVRPIQQSVANVLEIVQIEETVRILVSFKKVHDLLRSIEIQFHLVGPGTAFGFSGKQRSITSLLDPFKSNFGRLVVSVPDAGDRY